MHDDAPMRRERTEMLVCVVAGGSAESPEGALRGLLAHTPEETPIVMCGLPVPDLADKPAAERRVGSRPNLDAVLSAWPHADLIWIGAGCSVGAGWLEGLRAAAYVSSNIATASPLELQRVYRPAAQTGEGAARAPDPGQVSAAVRAASPRVRPRTLAANSHCAYVRRDALELIGRFEDMERFSRSCVERGLCHVIADDVLVTVGSGSRPDPPPRPISPVAFRRSVAAARRTVEGLTIVVDARVLKGSMNGTKRHVLELLAALGRVDRHRVGALLAGDSEPHVREWIDGLAGVDTLVIDDPRTAPVAFNADIVHRPYQIDTPADLGVLAQLANRLVITQQDLIGYHNPSYFPSGAKWRGYCDITRRAMAVADRVVFPSFHVLSEAIAEDLIEPHRAAVVRIGVDHSLTGPHIPKPGSGSPPPCAARALSAPEVILCLGSDLRHKNREFALRLLNELQRRHAWPGLLVFAGAHIPTGGSAAEESRLLERGLSLRDAVEDCGAVTEDEKEWLLSRAALVIYPTVSEGFGLVPFEAAAHDVPCLWAPGTSLSEVLPDSAAAIIPWDAGVAADRAVALIRDLEKRSANVAAVNKAAEELRWDAAAERLIEVYRVTCDEAAAPAGAAERGDGIMRSGLSEDALRLIGPDGALPRELERPLLALATHPRLGNPVFGAIKAGYRASFRLRRT